jgi:integrase/recombinase XerC
MPNEIVPRSSSPLAVPSQRVIDAWFKARNPKTLEAYKLDLADFASFTRAPSPAAAVELLLAAGHGAANEMVLDFKDHLMKRGLKSATVARRLSALRSMVKVARMIGRIGWTLDVESPKVETYRDTRGPGQDGFMGMCRSLHRAASRPDHRTGPEIAKRDLAMMVLMRDLLLRRDSVARLTLADVDLDAEPPTIAACQKGKADKRVFELPDFDVDRLRDWLQVRGNAPGPLFVRLDRAAGDDMQMQPMNGESINRAVRRAGSRAGLKRRVRAHGLRHQGITRLLELNNGNIPEAQALSGHAKPETLMKYNDNRQNAAGKSSQALAGDYDSLDI